MEQIKVYKVGECDWIAAENTDSAIEYFKEMLGYSDDDLKEEEIEAVEMSTEQMQKLQHLGDEGMQGPPYPRSFQAELNALVSQGVEFPRLFAATEI